MVADRRRVSAVVLALVLVANAALAGVGAARDHAEGGADEVYVEDDGDAVLVYESEGDADAPDRVEAGLDIAAGLAYGLVVDSVDEPPDVRGSVSATADRSSVSAEGSLSAPQPNWLESFDLSGSGVSNAENARSDLSLSVLSNESGLTSLVTSASTAGEVSASASRFLLSADASASTVVPSGPDVAVDATLRETDDAYVIEADVSQPINEWNVHRWRNRSVARETIREQFALSELAEETTVSLDSYSLTEAGEGYRLDAVYTVTYRGVDDALERLVRTGLAGQPDVSEAQADRLASEVAAVEIDEASLSYSVAGGDVDASLTLDIRGYDGLLLAYYELAESMGTRPGYGGNVERVRDSFEAQRESGVEQHYTWSADMNHPEPQTTKVQASFTYRTDNWAAYAEALEARGVPRYDTSFDLSGSADGDRVSVEGSTEYSGEDLYSDLLASLDNATGEDPETAALVQGLRDARFRKAKLDAAYGTDGLRVEFGAAFENMAALRDALAEQGETPVVSEAVVRTENGTGGTYVRVDGAVVADATESDVRALSAVGPDTTVHMPGDWDREFPSVDVERAETFLEPDDAGASGPGFGPIVAIVALIAASLVAIRRR